MASGQTGFSSNDKNQQTRSASAAPGTTIFDTSLENSLDSKESNVGDAVRVRVSEWEGPLAFPITEFIGHIIEVRPKGKNDAESILSLQFDRAVVTGGVEKPVSVGIRAIASPQSRSYAISPVIVDQYPRDPDQETLPRDDDHLSGLPPRLRGGTYSVFCGDKTRGSPRKQSSGCASLPDANGVFGFDKIDFRPRDSDPTGGSRITSKGRNINFQPSTHFILVVETRDRSTPTAP